MEKQTIFSDNEMTYPGLASCPGCTAALSFRLALKALGHKTICLMPASCSAWIWASVPAMVMGEVDPAMGAQDKATGIRFRTASCMISVV